MAAAHRWGPPNANVHAGADGCGVGLLGQLLDHQEAAQVTRARAAWPLRLGWKKSRLLTWLALNEELETALWSQRQREYWAQTSARTWLNASSRDTTFWRRVSVLVAASIDWQI